MNTYAYVAGNPLKYIDPFGLSQQDLDFAKKIIEIMFPEIFNENADVKFGDLPDDLGGETYWNGDIVISDEFSGCLTDERRERLLEYLYHEYMHSRDSFFTKYRTLMEDSYGIPGRHEEIIRESLNLPSEAYDFMNLQQ